MDNPSTSSEYDKVREFAIRDVTETAENIFGAEDGFDIANFQLSLIQKKVMARTANADKELSDIKKNIDKLTKIFESNANEIENLKKAAEEPINEKHNMVQYIRRELCSDIKLSEELIKNFNEKRALIDNQCKQFEEVYKSFKEMEGEMFNAVKEEENEAREIMTNFKNEISQVVPNNIMELIKLKHVNVLEEVKQKAKLKKEVHLKAKKAEIDEKLNLLKAKETNLENSAKAIEEQTLELEEEINGIQHQISNIKTSSESEIDKRTEKQNSLDEEIILLKNSILGCKMKYDGLTVKNTQTKEKLDMVHQEHADRQNKLLSLDEEILLLTKTIEEFKIKLEEIKQFSEGFNSCEESKQEYANYIRITQDKIENNKSQLIQIRNHLPSLKDANKALEKDVIKLEKNKEAIENEFNYAKEEYNSLVDQRNTNEQTKRTQKDNLLAEIKVVEQELAKNEQTYKDLLVAEQELLQKTETAEAAKANIEEEIKETQTEKINLYMSKFQDFKEVLMKESQSISAQINEQKNKIEMKKLMVEGMNIGLIKSHRDLMKQKNSEIEFKRREFDNLQRENEIKKRKISELMVSTDSCCKTIIELINTKVAHISNFWKIYQQAKNKKIHDDEKKAAMEEMELVAEELVSRMSKVHGLKEEACSSPRSYDYIYKRFLDEWDEIVTKDVNTNSKETVAKLGSIYTCLFSDLE